MRKELFYRPKTGVAADFIPYYDNGVFYLYYLHDFRNKDEFGEGTPWNLLTTKDFLNFKEHGEVLARGTKENQDLYVFTGSVIKDLSGLYHIFYTGHNPHFRAEGKPEQAVMHATSKNLIQWEKHLEDTFYAFKDEYELNDWRDPFVYYNADLEQYEMLLAARAKEGLKIRRGCTVVCVSKDLKKWSLKESLWQPNQFFTHECPDLFKIGDWWYLIYSEFTDRCMTRYVMSKDLVNWQCPNHDSFDGRAFYAAKTAFDGENRYIFGWIPTKRENDDHGEWQWGGNLAVHEVYQQPNGELAVTIPKPIYNSLISIPKQINQYKLSSPIGYKHVLLDSLDFKSGMIEIEIDLIGEISSFGFLVDYDLEDDSGYAYQFDQQTGRFGFSMQPNTPWNYSNFNNIWTKFNSDLRRHKLIILFEKNVFVAYIDNKRAVSTRIYNKHNNKGLFGFFVTNGSAEFLIKRMSKIE
jgi:beta-fructofuranosidase